MFELGGDSKEEFVCKGAGNELDVDGKTFRRAPHPLRLSH